MTHEQLRAIALEVAKETNLDIPESFIVDFALRFLAAVAEKAEPLLAKLRLSGRLGNWRGNGTTYL